MSNLISVIVPVYNVEAYLDQCVGSIAAQTHANLEIILVDDNSQDQSGWKCDRWAEKDTRIKVIHITDPACGGGPSRARNAGLNIAAGDHIGFVDSDDWIEPEMYERLLRSLQETSSDISVCGIEHVHGERTVRRTVGSPLVFDRETALKTLLEDHQIQNYAWDKLYRRELFSNMRFPEGKTFEDVLVQYRLFEKCNKVSVIPDVLYHYRRRRDSIVGSFRFPERLTFCMMNQERWEDLAERHPELIPNLAARYLGVVEMLANGLASLELEDAEREAAVLSADVAPFWKAHREEIRQLSDKQEQVQRLDRFLESPVSTVARRKMSTADGAAKKALDALQSENAGLRQELRSASDQRAALAADNSRLKDECDAGMKKALRLRRRIKVLKRECDAAREALEKLTALHADLEENQLELKRKLEEEQKKNDALKIRLKKRTKRHHAAQQKIKDMERSLSWRIGRAVTWPFRKARKLWRR